MLAMNETKIAIAEDNFVALLQTIQRDTFVIAAILCGEFIVNVLFRIMSLVVSPVKSEKRKTDRWIEIFVRVYSFPWKHENIFHSATVSIFPTHVYFIAAISYTEQSYQISIIRIF